MILYRFDVILLILTHTRATLVFLCFLHLRVEGNVSNLGGGNARFVLVSLAEIKLSLPELEGQPLRCGEEVCQGRFKPVDTREAYVGG